MPPPSQGYLTLAGAAVAERAGLGADAADPEWAHLLVEAWRAVGHDRPDMLYDGADGDALLDEDRIARAAARVSAERAAPADVAGVAGGTFAGAPRVARIGEGDTTHLCVCDADGLGVSLTQSNALDFGSHLVEPTTGVFLHNRGVGFSLAEGHPAEVRAGVRPPHTLSPMLVTAPEGPLTHLVGAMGGDAQPQIISQLLARLLRSGEDPARAIERATAGARRAVGRPVPVVVGRRPHGARRGRRAARMVRRAHGARAQDSGHQRVRPRGRRLRADHHRRATSRGGTVSGGRLGPAQS